MTTNKPWPDEIIKRMQVLTDLGEPASFISDTIIDEFHVYCTRNSVIGLWSRDRVKRRFTSSVNVGRPRRPRKPLRAPTKPRKAAPAIDAPLSYGGPLNGHGLIFIYETRLGQCMWPVGGDKSRLLVCGQPNAPRDKRYCPHHVERATSRAGKADPLAKRFKTRKTLALGSKR